ncbi:hypothetical protein [Microbaculum sp. FT89]|uniref:hypothetical protein n=1 Tax=Microbaculum sp. FT89 TaxID=3447298 RepID=UPI003F5319F3
MNRVLSILSVVLLIGVAACSEEEEKSEQTAPTSQSEPAKTEAPAPEAPATQAPTTQAPAAEAPATQAPASGTASGTAASGDTTSGDTTASEVSDAAIDACLAAVRQETGEADVAVLSTEFSEANSLVMIGVGAQRAPWKCLVSNDGQVAGVSFAGDEGKL